MRSLHAWVTAAWAGRGPFARALWPLSLVYGLIWRVRTWLYRWGWLATWRAPVPVVVVGNVVAGGAGKTPITLAMIGHLQARGWTPGVVSRGYGRRTSDVRQVQTDSHPADVGDEPLLIHRRTGVAVCVGNRRAEAVKALLAQSPGVDIVISDDGLQHLALARDVEIVVTDERLVGNGWLLPAGPLREPWPRRCDLWLHNGPQAPQGAWAMARHLGSMLLRADGTTVPIDSLRGTPVHAVAGIARPEPFFRALRSHGLDIRQSIALPDHVAYDDATIAATWGAPLLCTEKDAVKLWQLRPDALAVPLQLDLPDAFFETIDTLLRPLKNNRPL